MEMFLEKLLCNLKVKEQQQLLVKLTPTFLLYNKVLIIKYSVTIFYKIIGFFNFIFSIGEL